MQQAKIISFEEVKKIQAKKIFDWGVQEQIRMGCIAEAVQIVFDKDDFVDPPGCVVSIFYDQDTKTALLRRDWLQEMGVKYNLMTNYDEAMNRAPKSINHMMENAKKLYEFFDGKNGGITCHTKKNWA